MNGKQEQKNVGAKANMERKKEKKHGGNTKFSFNLISVLSQSKNKHLMTGNGKKEGGGKWKEGRDTNRNKMKCEGRPGRRFFFF
jgi:hypothetical protein